MARLIFHLKCSDHITDAVVSLHWLRVPEHIQYKIALLTYRVPHGMASPCLGPFVRAADLPSRRTLRSASTSRLVVPTFKRSAVGGRTFQVSGSRIWNLVARRRRNGAVAANLPASTEDIISSSNHIPMF